MLITTSAMSRLLTAIACTLATMFMIVATVTSPVSAAPSDTTCGPNETKVFVPPSSYVCQSNGGTTEPGTPGGGGGGTDPVATPTCDLKAIDGSDYDNPSAPYCAENKACVTVDLFAPVAAPEGEKPQEDSTARVEICRNPLGNVEPGTAFWSDDEEPPSRLEQAMEAIGNIDLGTATVNINPADRTLVNLDTWFWVTGTQREVSGSSAFGLVAVATFQSLSIDPGDGSGSFSCNTFPTTAAEAEKSCFHEYARASVRGTAMADGRPAFGITATSVYGLRFEVNGDEVEVRGAPTTLDGPAATAAVRVDEAQTVVRPSR